MQTGVFVIETGLLVAQIMVVVIRMEGFSQLQLPFAHRTIGIGTQINGWVVWKNLILSQQLLIN
jgi:hypothetical protein